MNKPLDTSHKVWQQYVQMMMQKTGEERLLMGCSMFDTAKEIVKSSLLSKSLKQDPLDLKRNIFLRFYGHEYNERQLNKIMMSLEK